MMGKVMNQCGASPEPARRLLTANAARTLSSLPLLAVLLFGGAYAHAQAGSGHTVIGDLKVEESKAEGMKPLTFDVILYYLDGRVHSRQRVASGGRYRFFGVRSGEYDIVVELDNQEIARIRINLGGTGPASDFRQDIELEWKGGSGGPRAREATVSAADFYEREGAARSSFEKAQSALDRKDYAQAAALLRKVTEADPKDFQAWTELGTALLLLKKPDEAERAYTRAVEARPNFFLALLNLGRTRSLQKEYEEAVEPLTRAAELQPGSSEANLLLGEAYLQTRRGSKAVPHLEAAARLGKAEAHLRLAALYNAAGMKDRAAAEYEQFLAKEPMHPERKKLEQYVRENKKQ